MRHTAEPIRNVAELIAFPSSRSTSRPLALETVSPEQAEALNRFYLRRDPLQTLISGRGATIRAAWSPTAAIGPHRLSSG